MKIIILVFILIIGFVCKPEESFDDKAERLLFELEIISNRLDSLEKINNRLLIKSDSLLIILEEL